MVLRRQGILLSALFTVILLSSCSNVKNKPITEDNKDKILDQIKNSKDLTVEEVGLLQAYVLRQGMKNAFSGDKNATLLPVGKTIGQVIEEQRKWVADESQRERQDKERRERAQAAAEGQRKALLDALSVTVYDKGYTSADFQNYITLKFAYENHTSKTIRGFRGSMEFEDLFGEKIKVSGLTEDEPLSPGESRKVSKTLNYNQFSDEDKKLRSTELANLKLVWRPTEILFTDGSRLKVDEADQ
jgi:hypothetical protein